MTLPAGDETGDASRTPLARPRRWRRRMALLVMSIVTALVGAEGALRLLGFRSLRMDAEWHAAYKRLHRPTKAGAPVPYEFIPGARAAFSYHGPRVTYRINADGLRADRRYERPKPPGVRRVLLLGDSVLFGIGVDVPDTFAARLERGLDRIEVVNSGVGGYNTYTERAWFDTVGRTYAPDLVVLCYCPNDVDDPIDHFSRHTLERLPPLAEQAIPNPEYHRELAARQSRPRPAVARLRTALMGTVMTVLRHSAVANLCARPFAFGRRTHTYERCLLAVSRTETPEYRWLAQQLGSLAASARRAKVPIAFVYLPLAYELGTDDPAYRRSRSNVACLAARCGYRVVDAFGTLAATATSHIDVTHLSASGHRAVANCLAGAIREALSTTSRGEPPP